MEIAPVPQRRPWSSPGRLLVVLLVLTPVTLFAAIPTMFGLERAVVTGVDMAPEISRGSVVLQRVVPVSDLRVGDVVSYQPPAEAGMDDPVTHRIVETGPGYLVTQGDASQTADPWLVGVSERPTMSKVVLDVPYVGYPWAGSWGTSVWILILVAATATLGTVMRREHVGPASRAVPRSSVSHVGH